MIVTYWQQFVNDDIINGSIYKISHNRIHCIPVRGAEWQLIMLQSIREKRILEDL